MKLKISAVLVCALFSHIPIAAAEAYSCKLDAKHTKGWIPAEVIISFDEDKNPNVYALNYPEYDKGRLSTLRHDENFREIKYRDVLKSSSNEKTSTTHVITILPKKDNKIIYNFKFDHYSNGYSAKGTCK